VGEDVTRILRYIVPVDDGWHTVYTAGRPLHVACRSADMVEFWAWESGTELPTEYRVYGTGHTVEPGATYVGTALTPGGHLVWHLVTRVAGGSS
jgi:hypothetical protein